MSNQPELTHDEGHLARAIESLTQILIWVYGPDMPSIKEAVDDPNLAVKMIRFLQGIAAKQRQINAFRARPIWQKIIIGRYKRKFPLLRSAKSKVFRVYEIVESMIDRLSFVLETKMQTVNLYIASVSEILDIDETKNGKIEQVRDALTEFGFGNCPVETALYLALRKLKLKTGQGLIVLTQPLEADPGRPRLLTIIQADQGISLATSFAYPWLEVEGSWLVVFAKLPKHTDVSP